MVIFYLALFHRLQPGLASRRGCYQTLDISSFASLFNYLSCHGDRATGGRLLGQTAETGANIALVLTKVKHQFILLKIMNILPIYPEVATTVHSSCVILYMYSQLYVDVPSLI